MGNTIATNIIDQYISQRIDAASAIFNSSSVGGRCRNYIRLGGCDKDQEDCLGAKAYKDCVIELEKGSMTAQEVIDTCKPLLTTGCTVEGDLVIDQDCTLELTSESIQQAAVNIDATSTMDVDAKQLADNVSQNFSLNPGDAVSCNIYKACLNLTTCLQSAICNTCLADFEASNEFHCDAGTYKGNIFVTQKSTAKILHKCIQDNNVVIKAKQDLIVKISQEATTHIEDTGTAMLMAIALILAILFIGAPLAKGVGGKKGGKKGGALGGGGAAPEKKGTSPIFKKLVLVIATGLLALLIADCQWLHMKCVPGIKWQMSIAGIVIYVILLFFIMKK